MRTILGILALTLCGVGGVPAQQAAVEESAPEALNAAESKVPAHYRAVLELIEAEQRDVEALTAQLDAATELKDIMQLERAIGQRRVQLQLEILELRQQQALAANQTELAAQIAESIQQLKHPQPLPAKQTLESRQRVRPN